MRASGPLLSIFISAFLGLSFVDTTARAHASPQVDDSTFIIGSEYDYPPYSFVNSSGESDGFALDLTRAIARTTGLKFSNVLGPWATIREKLANGEIDITPLMAISAERAQEVDFTDSYLKGFDAIFVRKEDPNPVRNEADLEGRVVIVLKGDFAHDYAASNAKIREIIAAESTADAFIRLNSGEADAVIASQVPGLLKVRELKVDGRIVMAEHPLITTYSRDFALAVRKGNKALVARLNEGLKAVRASGEFDRLYEKWFAELDPSIRARADRQRHLALGLLATLLLTGVLAGLVLVFKREVRKKTESLAEAESRLRHLITNIPGAAFQLRLQNGHWQWTYLGDAIEAMTGYPAKAFTHGDMRLAKIVHPDDMDSMRKQVISQISTTDRITVDYRIRHADGSTRWLHGRATPIMVNGTLTGLDGIMLDITEQKRVSELLTQQQSRMAASARLSALGEMAGGIAHEINNPLAIINLRTHQLSQLVERGSFERERVLDITNAIESTSMRISRIVKSLQTVARESEGDPFEVVPIKAILDDAMELCFQRMRKHGVEIQIEAFPEGLQLECRRVQISQVLINLLNNAFDAVSGAKTKTIRISIKDAANAVQFCIEDSGSGVPEDVAAKIFQPFFTTKGVGVGTGLGLSISKGSIESHGGEIWYERSASGGASFRFVLPKWQKPGNPEEGNA